MSIKIQNSRMFGKVFAVPVMMPEPQNDIRWTSLRFPMDWEPGKEVLARLEGDASIEPSFHTVSGKSLFNIIQFAELPEWQFAIMDYPDHETTLLHIYKAVLGHVDCGFIRGLHEYSEIQCDCGRIYCYACQANKGRAEEIVCPVCSQVY